MCYVAVNRDGTELISEITPIRNNKYGIWECETSVEGEWIDFQVELPKGSIHKLTGRSINWDNDYFEIN